MKKKQINVRLNPGTINQIKELQEEYLINGFVVSQADVIEDAIHQLHKKTFSNTDQEEK